MNKVDYNLDVFKDKQPYKELFTHWVDNIPELYHIYVDGFNKDMKVFIVKFSILCFNSFEASMTEELLCDMIDYGMGTDTVVHIIRDFKKEQSSSQKEGNNDGK